MTARSAAASGRVGRSGSRSLLVVNYNSAELTLGAVESARAASSEPLEVVIVDNSCSEDELARLHSMKAGTIVRSDRNHGYAGAINLGRPFCTGEIIIIANPDVVFARGSINLLCNVVTETGGVAGPRFSWDDGGEWLLPPANRASLASKFAQILSTHSAFIRSMRDRALARERLQFWLAASPHEVTTLSGAVLCVDAKLFDSLGGFDERFHLYFEENDFARRVSNHGARLTHVPSALCRHLFNQSAGRVPESLAAFARSENLFFRKWYGSWAVALMSLASSRARHSKKTAIEGSLLLESDPRKFLVELSPLPDFSSAVGYFPCEPTVAVPQEIVSTFIGSRLYLRTLLRKDLSVVAEHIIQLR
ncbi:MAG TPA: glycosyltransferase family 2 protein [Thermoanaerobaculia bacterium]|nr:glycosyltransferase family 2 protein [Thermoanaerobaculia bacterium]